MTLEALLRRHPRIGFDSNVFIYLLEGGPPEADIASALIDALGHRDTTGTLAMLGLTEILSGPARADDAALADRYADELFSLEGLRIPVYGRELAIEAAVVRGAVPSLTTADAIHLASARLDGATAFVTNDRGITRIDRLDVVYLNALAAD